jgi:regulator of replication initiation timing
MGLAKPSLEKAIEIVETIRKARKRWGRAAGSAQYGTNDVLDALDVIFDESNHDGPSKAELTKANRQLAACSAREAGYKERTGDLNIKVLQLEAELKTVRKLQETAVKTAGDEQLNNEELRKQLRQQEQFTTDAYDEVAALRAKLSGVPYRPEDTERHSVGESRDS